MLTSVQRTILPEADWLARRQAHERRVAAWTEPHQARTARGEKHPVYDFLFEYYRFRPSWLRRWHPGPDVVLQGEAAREFLRRPEYQEVDGGVALNCAALEPRRRETVAWMLNLLRATAERPPQFACFGLHEWAMVYRQPQERRHTHLPLRLGAAGTDAVLEASTLRCTHFDATRFFTPEGLARNTQSPTREGMVDHEQPGCLHAGMDVYRWAYKLAPAIPSDLLIDAFVLAREIRTLDMRASPYDVTSLGYEPVKIEEPEGRRDYAAQQRAFAERANALRRRLLGVLDELDLAAGRPRATANAAG
jgi:hypothetical protein